MNQPNEQELVRIAASFRLTGELLEANGTRSFAATGSWAPGPRSANLDPNAGGWRYDDEGEPIPNDTTGEQALRYDPNTSTGQRLVQLVLAGDRINTEIRKILYAACPQNTMPDNFEPDTPAQISAAGWCVSCHRDNGHLEPVSMRPDGVRRYRDHCTFCGQFKAAHTILPPLNVLKLRHEGRRISARDVEAAVRAELEKQKASKKGKRKKGKAAA